MLKEEMEMRIAICDDEKIALEADRIITIEDGKIISDQKRR